MKSMFKIAVATVAVASLVGLAGCSSSGGDGGTAEGGGDKKLLGIVNFAASDIFTVKSTAGAAEYAEENGWDVQIVDANGSVDEANAAMVNLVTSGADALVVSVFPSDALGEGVAAATDAGVPVANWGGGAGSGVQFGAMIGLGKEIAEKVVDDMGGEGALLTLGYRPGLPCQLREADLDEALSGTNIDETKQQIVIPGTEASTIEAVNGWAAAHPAGGDEPLAIWGCFDDIGVGIATALRDLGRTDIKTYSINGTEAAVSQVSAGDLGATLWIDGPGMGRQLAELLFEYIEDPEGVEVPQEVEGETFIVDGDTVEEFLAGDPVLY